MTAGSPIRRRKGNLGMLYKGVAPTISTLKHKTNTTAFFICYMLSCGSLSTAGMSLCWNSSLQFCLASRKVSLKSGSF